MNVFRKKDDSKKPLLLVAAPYGSPHRFFEASNRDHLELRKHIEQKLGLCKV